MKEFDDSLFVESHTIFVSARDYINIRGIVDDELLERPKSLEGYVYTY